MAQKISIMEKGVYLPSVRIFFTPPDSIQDLYFYLAWCGHYYCDQQYIIDRNNYPYLLYVYVIKGTFNLHYNQKYHALTKGQACLIDCRYPHRYSGSEGLEFIFYNFAGSNAFALCASINQQNGYIFEGEQAHLSALLCHELLDKIHHNEYPSFPRISENIHALLMLFSEPKEKYILDFTTLNQPILLSITYMQKHFQESELNLDTLAQHVNLSKFYFSRLFKRRMLCSPKEYLLNLRINHAKYLLKNTVKPLEIIASEIGYDNLGSFTNYFTKKVGLSPSRFRKTSI